MQDLEFIRQLLNIIDNTHSEDSPEQSLSKQSADDYISVVDNNDRDVDDPDPRDVKNAMDKDDIFIPPLQQRIEMLKKLTGVNPKDREILSHIDGDDVTAS
jgi:hypothetical protein